jgi:hypothetical protein
MIDLSTLFSGLGIVGGNTASQNQYQFYYGVEWSDLTKTYNQYQFFQKTGLSRKEFFETYALNERDFYSSINDARIIDYRTFYQYAGEYLTAAPVSDWILATGFWNDSGFWRDGENWID